MPSPASASKTNQPTSRTRIPLSSAAPVYFVPERDPLLPPTVRPTELPMSSQSDSSPVNLPSIPLKAENELEGSPGKQEEEEEDDFDGIEDVPLSQYIPSVPRSRKKPDVGLTLDDLFSDEGNVEDMISMAASGKQNMTSQSSADADHKSPQARMLSSSPIFASSSSTSKHRAYQSDTPPSPLLHTPHNDVDINAQTDREIDDNHDHDDEAEEIGVEWTPSPMSQRTKARRFGGNSPVNGEMDTGSDLEIISPTNKRSGRLVGEGSSTGKKAKVVAEVEDFDDGFGRDVGMGMDDFDDVGFFEGVDFDSLDHPTTFSTSASGSAGTTKSKPIVSISKPPATSGINRPDQTAKNTLPDPGRAFRPSSTSTSTSTATKNPFPPSSSRQSSPPSDILAMLDDQLRPDRLMLITDLSTAEQEFYKNHWRRGADKVKKRQEDYWSDGDEGGGGGPQPKKAARRPVAKRGFRGRGRARGRGRGRK